VNGVIGSAGDHVSSRTSQESLAKPYGQHGSKCASKSDLPIPDLLVALNICLPPVGAFLTIFDLTDPMLGKRNPSPLLVVGFCALFAIIGLPFVIEAFSKVPGMRARFVPHGDKPWLTIKLDLQIAFERIVPAMYVALGAAYLVIVRPSGDQMLRLMFWFGGVWLTSMLGLGLFCDSLGDPGNTEGNLIRDISAFSRLARSLCRDRSPDCLRILYAATSRLDRYLRNRALSWKSLRIANHRLRVISRIRPIDYSSLSYLADGLRFFPDLTQVRCGVAQFVDFSGNWLDDMKVETGLLSPARRLILRYAITLIPAAVALVALFVPDIRQRLISSLESVSRPTQNGAPTEVLAYIVAIALLFTTVLWMQDRLFKPSLTKLLITSLKEEIP
jgi:hypothetical protein